MNIFAELRLQTKSDKNKSIEKNFLIMEKKIMKVYMKTHVIIFLWNFITQREGEKVKLDFNFSNFLPKNLR